MPRYPFFETSLAVAVTMTMIAAAGLDRRAFGTPSTAFWTPATPSVQRFGLPHVTYDTYFGEAGAYGIDTGLTVGVLPWSALQMEVGVDLVFPNALKGAVQMAAKIGLPEEVFGAWSPGLSTGVMGVGFTKGVSDYHLWHAEVGKTVRMAGISLGALSAGAYYGLGGRTTWSGSDGTVRRAGFLGSYTSPDVRLGRAGLDKLTFLADVQTGRNAVGAFGIAIGLYFAPAISLLTGPVLFFDHARQPGASRMLWSVQLDVDVDLGGRAAP